MSVIIGIERKGTSQFYSHVRPATTSVLVATWSPLFTQATMMIHYRNLAPPMCQGLWISGTFRLSSPCVAAFPEKALPKREEQALSVPAVAISAMRSSQALLRLAGGRRLRCTKQVEAGRVFKILAQLPDIFSMMCFSWFFWRRIYDLYDIFGEHIMGLPVFFTHVC